MAVYTQLTPNEIAQFLSQYNCGTLVKFEGIKGGVSNTNYHVWTDKGRYVLTVFEDNHASASDIPFFLEFAKHISDNAVACPSPVSLKDGSLLTEIREKPAAMFPFLSGDHILDNEIKPLHCAQIGGVLAKMHNAAQTFKMRRKNRTGAKNFAEISMSLQDTAGEFNKELPVIINEELIYIAQHWPNNLPKGAIHDDLFPDNVFFKDDKLSAVIDFYISTTDAYAYDLAITINAWCFDCENKLIQERFDALIDAYNNTRPLSDGENAALVTLLRGAALRFLLFRLELIKNDAPQKDPNEYLQKMLHWKNVCQ